MSWRAISGRSYLELRPRAQTLGLRARQAGLFRALTGLPNVGVHRGRLQHTGPQITSACNINILFQISRGVTLDLAVVSLKAEHWSQSLSIEGERIRRQRDHGMRLEPVPQVVQWWTAWQCARTRCPGVPTLTTAASCARRSSASLACRECHLTARPLTQETRL